ncbi:hypothetical protein ACGFZH_28160 [Streptomyces zaomyceticus]|uniref:hypothetical protein n=1 Tax=Streptomyces zaomyceticus TaxID=68286 RepID=UPI003719CAFD
MTERPYTDDDLRAEAARQHATLTEDPDYVGVGEAMEDRMVTPDGNVEWGDFTDETHDAAQHSIYDLITGATNVSEWAVALGADGLVPYDGQITLDGDSRPFARIHFAFDPGMPEEMRLALVEGVGTEIARHL